MPRLSSLAPPSVMRHLVVQSLAIGCLWSFPLVGAKFDMSVNTNLAIYWGQDSYGDTHPNDTANWQKTLSYYCQSDSTADIIPMAFLTNVKTTSGLPSVNFANTCNFNGTFPSDCAFLEKDIGICQDAGKIVTISLGGSYGNISFPNDTEGEAFAQTIWDLFLGGSAPQRPFGKAVLDGIDMDIEGGTQTGFKAFLTTLRKLMDGGSKSYYITAAPQCPYPDQSIGDTLNAVPFDAVFVQFYNNYCGLDQYPTNFNFDKWDNWAKTAPNPKVKVFLGAAASSTAAGSGYVNVSTITDIICKTQPQYTSFGGAMLWEMSQAYANERYDIAVKKALTGATCVHTPPAVSPWQSDVAYAAGDQVTYNGYLWSAQWQTSNEVPGGPAGIWVNEESSTTTHAVVPEGEGLVVQEAFGIFPEAVELVWNFISGVADGLPE